DAAHRKRRRPAIAERHARARRRLPRRRRRRRGAVRGLLAGAEARRPARLQRRHPRGRGRALCAPGPPRRRTRAHRNLGPRQCRRPARPPPPHGGHAMVGAKAAAMAGAPAMTGTLHLVGVGPGDPELITLKAARILGAADVVAYPTTGEDAAFALSIAEAHLNPSAIRLPVAIPMRVDRGPAQAAYDEAAAAILAHLGAGRDVAWLCEGDPLFYGSAMYLVARVAPHAPVAVTPGVTSLTAAAAAIARPLAARNEMLKVLPAPLP